MFEFLKLFGKGFLYFLALPFLFLFLCFYGIYLLFLFIGMTFKRIVYFFKGKRNFFILPEDLKAEEILQRLQTESIQKVVNNQTTNNVTYNNTYNVNVSSARGAESLNGGNYSAIQDKGFIDATTTDNNPTLIENKKE